MTPGGNTPELESFYHLGHGPLGDRACQGTACFVARHLRPDCWRQAVQAEARVYCLGTCAGTVLVRDIAPGASGSGPSNMNEPWRHAMGAL